MKYAVLRIRPKGVLIACLAFCLALGLMARLGERVLPVNSQERHLPVYSVETEEKKVVLGINCAWDNADIPQLLEILDSAGVKATFFVSGSWCNKFPESVKAIAEAGHEVGSHSNTHADLTTLDKAGIQEEIRRCNDKIEALIGRPARYFRTPSGSYNDLVIQTIEEEGMIPIQWDCDSVDYRNPSPDEMRERILGKLRPGSILLFHSGAQNTPAALPGIIQSIQGQGYEFVTVSGLVYPPPYTVDFEGRQHRQ